MVIYINWYTEQGIKISQAAPSQYSHKINEHAGLIQATRQLTQVWDIAKALILN